MPNKELIESSIEIEASPAAVWAVVSDLKRMGEWSPQCKKMFVRGEVKKGSRSVNVNQAGMLRWPTTSKVIEFEPNRVLAFQMVENRTIWSYELEETATGTRLTESRKAPHGVPALINKATARAFGSIDEFESNLERGIQKTLVRIKSEVEA